MMQMIITAIGTTCKEPSAQCTYGNDTCNGCGQTGHYITDCPIIECMINEGKCRRNIEGRIVLPGGGWVPRSIPGKHLAKCIKEWHRCNLNQIVEGRLTSNTNVQLIYDIAPSPATKLPIQSTYVSASPPLTPPMQQVPLHLTKEDRILALKRELLTLQRKQVFDGIEIVCRPARNPQNKESTHSRTSQMVLNNKQQPSPTIDPHTKTTEELLVHPYSNVPEACFAPPTTKVDQPLSALKGKESTTHTIIPIQNPKIVDEVYQRAMKVHSVTVSHEELLLLSPDLHQHHREQVTPKRIPTTNPEPTSANLTSDMLFAQFVLDTREQDDKCLNATPPASSVLASPDPIILSNLFEQYINNLCPSEAQDPDVLIVTKELHTLRSIDMLIDNQEYVEAIVDPGSQIITMSEAVCHDLGLQYDPHIWLYMQSVNGEVYQSLRLACNIQVHII